MKKLLILTHDEVHRLLLMPDCIELMSETLAGLARGEFLLPLRTGVRPPQRRDLMAMMPAVRNSEPAIYGLKAICIFPQNPARGMDAHQGGVLLFSGETGELLALINASAITEIRTAAVSAVATRLLARPEARNLAIVGAGVQARAHLEALPHVRSIRSCRVVSRSFDNAKTFAEKHSASYPFPIEAVGDAKDAVRGADIIVTATSSLEPVLNRDWISPGTHINAVGTYSPAAREIDTATMATASLFADRRESLINEAGDYLLAVKEGAIGPEHIKGELGEILTGTIPGRQSDAEITLFKSLGLAVEDLAAADFLFQRAQEKQAGTWVDF
jgi:ornithine cyclodeaminase/alanine dehydrogenase-like protein (mu-crystallin family)